MSVSNLSIVLLFSAGCSALVPAPAPEPEHAVEPVVDAGIAVEFHNPVSWRSGAQLAQGRLGHSATVLQGARLLVVGGEEYAKPMTASVEVFTEATGQWATLASLPAATANHTATLVGDQVLIAGGGKATADLFPSGAVTNKAFLFDSTSQTWVSTGSLHVARSHHQAVRLVDGRVLVIGGAGATHSAGPRLADALSGCELFDSATGTWSLAAPLHFARFFHTAVVLASGRVLVAGGANEREEGFASAELYDPATDEWTVTGSMSIDRLWHAMTTLPSGKVLVVGGKKSNVRFLSSAEVYDPATGLWSPAAGREKVGNGASLVTLPTGRALLTGGYGVFGAGGFETLGSSALYDEATDAWSMMAAMVNPRTLHHASIMPTGTVVVTGGLDDVSDGVRLTELSADR